MTSRDRDEEGREGGGREGELFGFLLRQRQINGKRKSPPHHGSERSGVGGGSTGGRRAMEESTAQYRTLNSYQHTHMYTHSKMTNTHMHTLKHSIRHAVHTVYISVIYGRYLMHFPQVYPC